MELKDSNSVIRRRVCEGEGEGMWLREVKEGKEMVWLCGVREGRRWYGCVE